MDTKQTRIYIAGAIESVGGNLNEPLFDFVAQRLREQGCEVFNPWDLTRELVGPLSVVQALSKEERKTVRKGLMLKELTWICQNAEVMLMLPGWEQSPGATAERAVALALDIPVHEAPNTVLPAFQQRNENKATVDAVVLSVK